MKRFQVKINDTDVIHVLSFNSVNNLTSRGGKFTLKCLDLTGTFYDSISAGDELMLLDNIYLIDDDFSSYNTAIWTDPQPTGAAIVSGKLEITSTNQVGVEVYSNETFYEQVFKANVRFTDNTSNIGTPSFGFYNANTGKYILIYANATQIVAIINSDGIHVKVIGTTDTDFHDIMIDWTNGNVDFYLDDVKTTLSVTTPTDRMDCYLDSSSGVGVTSISSVDYAIVYRTNVFGGYLENIKREVKRGKVIEITGNDYTAKLHNLMVYSLVYRKRELSVMVRELAFQDLIKPVDIDNCEATTGWNYPAGFDSFDVDSSSDANGNPHARVGTNCLKGVIGNTHSGGPIWKTFSSHNITAKYSLGMYFFIEDASKLDYVTMYLGNSHVYSYYYTKVTADFSDGWNYLIFNIAEPTGTGMVAPYLSNVTFIEFDIRTLSPYPQTTFRIDDLKFFQRNSDNFRLDNVQTTEIYLEDALFRNLTLFQCYQRICSVREELYDFYIDINKCINFGEFGTIASGETIERGTNLISAKFDDNPKKLFNDVVLYGGRQHFTFNEKFNGDGANDTFSLQYEPVNAEVSVGGTIQKGYKADSGESFDYKIDFEAKDIIFESGSIPAGGTNNVDITYTYSVPTIVRKKDSISITKYGLRQTKLENSLITTVTDGKEVVTSFLNKNKDPLAVGKIVTLINTDIDVGETIQFIDSNLFSSTQTLTVIEIANYFIGQKPHTELTVTEDSETVEDFLVEIFRRLNAVEEINKGISEITTQLEVYSEDEAIADAAANLVAKTRTAAGFILGHPTLGLIGNNIGSNTNTYGGDVLSGKSG